jgi:hypothetical protein
LINKKPDLDVHIQCSVLAVNKEKNNEENPHCKRKQICIGVQQRGVALCR